MELNKLILIKENLIIGKESIDPMYELKYDKINIRAKSDLDTRCEADMLYNVTHSDRVINKQLKRYYNFYFNPKPYCNENKYLEILERIISKNKSLKDFRVKSLEVNFDYQTRLSFKKDLSLLAKVLACIFSKKGFKTFNINGDNQNFNYKKDNLENRFESYKFYKKKGKHKFVEIKLYPKNRTKIRFEIIFYNVDNRFFKILEDSLIYSGDKIGKYFKRIYSDFVCLLKDEKLCNDKGIVEFIKAFYVTLSNLEQKKCSKLCENKKENLNLL